MSEGEYYEVCDSCGESVRLVFKEAEDYTHAKLKCDCSESVVAFGNISIRDIPESWGES